MNTQGFLLGDPIRYIQNEMVDLAISFRSATVLLANLYSTVSHIWQLRGNLATASAYTVNNFMGTRQ